MAVMLEGGQRHHEEAHQAHDHQSQEQLIHPILAKAQAPGHGV
jgi:hypothetical protein